MVVSCRRQKRPSLCLRTGAKAIMGTAMKKTHCLRLLLLLCGIVFAVTVVPAADWHVKEAPIRFTLELTGNPSHESCGYFVHLPDGGMLPTPFPLTHVVTRRGKPVESCVLWQNRLSGLALVFADPGGGGEVHVYVSAGKALKVWNAASGLTPSAILCADPTVGDMSAARKLAGLGTVGPTVHYRLHRGHPKAALSIGCDLSGRPRPCSFHLLAHVVTSDPGRTWIAPLTLDGQCEVRVDGQAIVPKKRIAKWGGTGQYVMLSKGLNRVDVLQASGGTGDWSRSNKKGGLMYLTWRTPKATMAELGGVRSKKAPMPGTSAQETRVLRADEVAQSGRCRITDVRSRDGGPVPCITTRPRGVFWFEGERPIIVYGLTAGNEGSRGDTGYEWDFGGGAKLAKPEVFWPFAGGREHRITLIASRGGKTARAAKPFYGYANVETSLENAESREVFRKAALNVFEAYPATVDPTGAWDASMWNNFFRTMELGKGQDLLTHIFAVRWPVLQTKLPAEQTQVLLNIFFDFLPRVSPEKALQWTEKIELASKRDRARAELMKIVRAEIYIYYLRDLDKARESLAEIARKRDRDSVTELARIRMGDIAFLDRRLNEATRIYGDVQNRVQRGRTVGPSARGGSSRLMTAEDRRRQFLERSSSLVQPPDEPEEEEGRGRRKRRRRGEPEPEPPKPPSFRIDRNIKVQDWKLNALLDVSASENVKTLVDQGYFLEAKQALQKWERESPLSKVSGDYILNESELYMKLEDWPRARAMLEAYCELVDASSFIPDATEAVIRCMLQMDEPKANILKFYEGMEKKLEFHPAASEVKDLISNL